MPSVRLKSEFAVAAKTRCPDFDPIYRPLLLGAWALDVCAVRLSPVVLLSKSALLGIWLLVVTCLPPAEFNTIIWVRAVFSPRRASVDVR